MYGLQKPKLCNGEVMSMSSIGSSVRSCQANIMGISKKNPTTDDFFLKETTDDLILQASRMDICEMTCDDMSTIVC